MKGIKSTIRHLIDHEKGQKPVWRTWAPKLWRDYLMLALCGASALFALMGTAIACFADSGAQRTPWIVALAISTILSVVGMVRAHKAMRKVLGNYERQEMGSNRRNLLLVEGFTLLCAVAWTAFLPLASLAASAWASAATGAEGASAPWWAYAAFVVLAVVAIFALEVAMTFARATFRHLPSLDSGEQQSE